MSPAIKYLFKVNKKKAEQRCEICLKTNFEHISQLFLVFLLLTLNSYMFAEPGESNSE